MGKPNSNEGRDVPVRAGNGRIALIDVSAGGRRNDQTHEVGVEATVGSVAFRSASMVAFRSAKGWSFAERKTTLLAAAVIRVRRPGDCSLCPLSPTFDAAFGDDSTGGERAGVRGPERAMWPPHPTLSPATRTLRNPRRSRGRGGKKRAGGLVSVVPWKSFTALPEGLGSPDHVSQGAILRRDPEL